MSKKGTAKKILLSAFLILGTVFLNMKFADAATLPTVITTTPTSIATATATSGGDVTSNGGANITSRGVVWSTSPDPTIALSTKVSGGTGNGVFTSNVTGLLPNTTYNIRAYATNSVGTAYGSNLTFTTSALSLPTISTNAVSNITLTGATSGGNVTSNGGANITARGIVWSTSPDPTIALTTKVSGGTGNGTFASNITGLVQNTTYHVRAYATNSVGTSYGPNVTFTTSALTVPTVTTTDPSSITTTGATTGGNVTSGGNATVTERGIVLGFSPNPTIVLSKVVGGKGTGAFTSNITGLAQNTTYHVRAYATNSVGTAYGQNVTFTTGALTVPTVTTADPSSITPTGAVSGGNVTSGGNATVTSRGVVWSTSPDPTIALTTKVSGGTGTGAFTSNITGLSVGVTYHVRAYATNSIGTAYGPNVTFTTSALAVPTVTTADPSSVTTTGATVGGNVTSSGNATVTARGVVWSTSQNPTTALTTKVTGGTGTGAFTGNITGLSQNTTYHVRAYATNSVGTAYGPNVTFTTGTLSSPTISTNAVSNITLTGATTGGNVTSGGNATVTARGVVWSTSQNPTTALTTKVSGGTGTGSFTSNITGLSQNTTYHVRAYATNSVGTSYGPNITFTTGATSAPSVTTVDPSSITSTTAVAGGNVTSGGSSAVTARGIVWSTAPNPTTALTTKVSGGTGTGSFTGNITGLSQNTTYHVRAYATNSVGTSYGSNVTFTTGVPNLSSGNSVRIGSSLNITWSNLTSVNSKDWIAIVPSGATWVSGNPRSYTGGTSSGSLSLPSPSTTGTYDVVFYRGDNTTTELLRRRGVTVLNTAVNYGELNLSVSPSNADDGENLDITFSNIGADYYELEANCGSEVEIDGDSYSDICESEEKIYPGTNSSISISDLYVYYSGSKTKTVSVQVTAYKDGENVKEDSDNFKVIGDGSNDDVVEVDDNEDTDNSEEIARLQARIIEILRLIIQQILSAQGR